MLTEWALKLFCSILDDGLVPSKTPERPPNVIPYYCIYTLTCSITIGETASSVMHSGPHVMLAFILSETVFSLCSLLAAAELFFLERVTASASAARSPLSIDIIVFAFWSRAAPEQQPLRRSSAMRCIFLSACIWRKLCGMRSLGAYMWWWVSPRELTLEFVALTLFYLTSCPPTQHFTAIKRLILNGPTTSEPLFVVVCAVNRFGVLAAGAFVNWRKIEISLCYIGGSGFNVSSSLISKMIIWRVCALLLP